MIPKVIAGSMIVRNGVGVRPMILGKELSMVYHQTDSYLEIDINMGDGDLVQTIRKIVTPDLVVDLAFLIEPQTEAELPEEILGAIRFLNVDLDKISMEPSAYRDAELQEHHSQMAHMHHELSFSESSDDGGGAE